MKSSRSMSKSGGVTFKEAVAQGQKKATKLKHTHFLSQPDDDSLPDLQQLMQTLIEAMSSQKFQDIGTSVATLKKCGSSGTYRVRNWRDEYSLDLLHYSIIYNAPDVINELLSGDDPFFPSNSKPVITPYAHLAALLGNPECLKLILHYRPKDFFISTECDQAIKLPQAIIVRYRLHEPAKTKVNKVIIKEVKEIFEKPATNPDDDEVLGELEIDIFKAEKDNVQGFSSIIVKKVHKPRENSLFEVLDVQVCDSPVCKNTQHLITKYREPFLPDITTGVLGAAGHPVQVLRKRAEDAPFLGPKNKSNNTSEVDLNASCHEGNGNVDLNKTASVKKEISSPQETRPTESPRSSNTLMGPGYRLEYGVRVIKNYKTFQAKIDSNKRVFTVGHYLNTTPLCVAAQRGSLECVRVILDMLVKRKHQSTLLRKPLTLATKAKSADAIMLLLQGKVDKMDYQVALKTALYGMFPDCLGALICFQGKAKLWDNSLNILHHLYINSLNITIGLEHLPEMTRVLIQTREYINNQRIPGTYPLYTLIQCAFKVRSASHIKYYNRCFELLLQAKANPNMVETVAPKSKQATCFGSRLQGFTSAFQCLLKSATSSLDYFEDTRWSKLFLKKLVLTLEKNSRIKPSEHVLNSVLFQYMEVVCEMGIDKTVVKCCLRCGANPNYKRSGKYAINVYFDRVFKYLVSFEVMDSYERYQTELTTLMIICKYMNSVCLREALDFFLNEHLLKTPVQALPLCRYFCWLMNAKIYNPRPLLELASLNIWQKCGGNCDKVKQLKVPLTTLMLILP